VVAVPAPPMVGIPLYLLLGWVADRPSPVRLLHAGFLIVVGLLVPWAGSLYNVGAILYGFFAAEPVAAAHVFRLSRVFFSRLHRSCCGEVTTSACGFVRPNNFRRGQGSGIPSVNDSIFLDAACRPGKWAKTQVNDPTLRSGTPRKNSPDVRRLTTFRFLQWRRSWPPWSNIGLPAVRVLFLRRSGGCYVLCAKRSRGGPVFRRLVCGVRPVAFLARIRHVCRPNPACRVNPVDPMRW